MASESEVQVKDMVFTGFADVADLVRCMWPVTSTAEGVARYKKWLENDRSKAGLLALQDSKIN